MAGALVSEAWLSVELVLLIKFIEHVITAKNVHYTAQNKTNIM